MTDIAHRDETARSTVRTRAMPGMAALDGALRYVGPALLILSCGAAAALGGAAYAPYGADTAFGVAVGAAGFVAMAEALILAARPRFLEPLFGGLDRMYRAHKWLGVSALALMILHDMREPDFDRIVRESRLGDMAGEAGELVFNVLLALVAVSWFRRLPFVKLEIPYHLWRFSHRAMGALFAVAAFHQFFVDMPKGVDPTLSIMLNLFAVAGLIAWVQTQFLAPFLRRKAYTVREIVRQGEVTSLTLAPEGRAMRWRPGQFVFLGAPEAGLSEPHPFTIASAPRADGALTLSIRALGGWTRRLPLALRESMNVQIEGPYGRFDFRKGGAKQIWLAGGVGVTPFLAWAESLTAADQREIHLVYSVRSLQDAMGLEALEAAAARNRRFSFEVVATQRDGRLAGDQLVTSTPFAVSEADLWFCGPSGLKDGLLKDLRALGQSPRRLRFEHFRFA